MAVWNPSVPQACEKGLEEIKKILESKLSGLRPQLRQLRDVEANNPIDQLPSRNLEQTKKSLIQFLIDRVMPKSPDFCYSGELLFKEVLDKLEMQLKETTRMIASEKCELNKLNKKLNSLQAKCESFDNIVSARLESGEMKQAENLDKIKKNLQAELQKHKKMLRYVVNTAYPEDGILKQLLEALFQSYFENPMDYIEFSDNDFKILGGLMNIGLVVHHPYELMKVKLAQG